MDKLTRRTCLGLLAGLFLTACAPATSAPATTRIAIVTAPTAEQPQPRLTTADEQLVRTIADTDTGVLDLVVAGDDAAARHWDLTPLRQISGGRREVEHGPARAGLITASLEDVRSALAGLAPSAGSTNLLRAIDAVARSGPPGTMIVADSGVTTTDPLDLAVTGWEQDPAALVADLRTRGFLPDLTGWTVRFTSLGRVAGVQPVLPTPQLTWLEDLWLGLCRGAGAAECVVDRGAGPAMPAASTRRVPPVAIPAVTTLRGRDGTTVTTLPASRLGFREGSAELPAGADQVLADLITRARGGDVDVQVDGYVAWWGSSEYQQGLSEARARAVADRLVAGGVPARRVAAAGRGAADGPQASQTAGVFDEAKVLRAGLRRVVVTVRPTMRP